jgi:CO/xanthine dehydrogenase Mo-binding subunit
VADPQPEPTCRAPAELPKDLAANPVLARWIRVGRDGVIDVRVGKVELGQGILTALAQLAADELDADLADIRMRPADTLAGPDEGVTAGSLSVSDCGPALRLAAACVRARFVAAASGRWGVDPADVLVVSGRITGPAGQQTSYGRLAGEVALDVAADPAVPVKAAAAQRLTGTDVPRLDLPDKVLGRPRYVHDMRLPGQWFARVVRPPSPGAHLIGLDAAVAGQAVTLVRDGSFLAVAGPDEAEVVRAAIRVRAAATWSERDTLPDENDLDGFLRTGPHERIPVVDDGATAPPVAGRRLRATYRRPFLAHASIAPSCAVAEWHPDGRVEVWSHSQGIANLGRAIAAALELDPGTVHTRHVEGAGCYGHNGADDAAFDAVLVARAIPGRPVQVVWSRQDELTWSPLSSAMVADVEATLDAAGRLGSWRYDVWSQGHTARPGYAGVPGLLAATTLARPATYPAPVDPPLANGAGSTRNALPGYELPNRRVTGHRLLRTPIRSSAMRSLGAHLNVFAIESFMDEAALAAGADPVEFRLAHLGDERGRRVLRMAADAAGWGGALPDGTGRGIGYARYKGSGAWCAVVAEVEAEHEVRVRLLTVAIDVGRVVNPDGVRNQVEGGAVQSASWTLVERVRFDRRRITSVDWETYPILPFSRVPEVRVEIAPGDGNPSVGAGEAAQGPTAAAIGNALAAAAGVRVRNLPLTTEAVIEAIESDRRAGPARRRTRVRRPG